MTAEQLAKIMPSASSQDLSFFSDPLTKAMEQYGINTPVRQAAFLGQIATESDQLWHLRSRFGTPCGEEYASGAAYEGRKDLGNTQPGDGKRYKGRGLIQTTGRSNYEKLGKALGVDFVSHPEKLLEPAYCCASACFYWQSHGLNELADAVKYVEITKRINGGLNGFNSRLHFWQLACQTIGAPAPATQSLSPEE